MPHSLVRVGFPFLEWIDRFFGFLFPDDVLEGWRVAEVQLLGVVSRSFDLLPMMSATGFKGFP